MNMRIEPRTAFFSPDVGWWGKAVLPDLRARTGMGTPETLPMSMGICSTGIPLFPNRRLLAIKLGF